MSQVDVRPEPVLLPLQKRPRLWVAWVHVLIAAVLGIVVGAVSFVVVGYVKVTTNVKHEAVATTDLGPRPDKVSPAMNVLIVGSDVRKGANAKYGDFAGERTDTIILAHISPKRDGATLISFPRDSLVALPECPARKGFPGQNAHVGMINESFNSGGIGCTWKTIETLTKIHIDHYVKVDFTGFKGMVDALGGVPVCVPEPGISDKKALLTLPPGRQTLDGEQSLGYVRARYSLGDGSDIGRIQRQQMFLAAMSKKAMSGETLTNPGALLNLLDAVTKSITTDPDLTPSVLKDLALSAEGLQAGSIRFITTPWHYSLTSPGRVEWTQPQAKSLFTMAAQDELTAKLESGEQRIPKSQIHVVVQNGSGRGGLATNVAAVLEQRGYHILKVEDAPKPYPKTFVKYTPSGQTRAVRVFRELLKSTTFNVKNGTTQQVVLVLGSDYQGLKQPKASIEDVEGFDATHDTCTTQ
ncbi:LCP family protein [Herbidospora mongoliensis]|uniref:LCP family protein n=1 Tax=Herbidospora mongoliensis TaxID=688067 RepID=UPI00082FF216|nr:LCP family protein [Herbidospora mongoliensis]